MGKRTFNSSINVTAAPTATLPFGNSDSLVLGSTSFGEDVEVCVVLLEVVVGEDEDAIFSFWKESEWLIVLYGVELPLFCS